MAVAAHSMYSIFRIEYFYLRLSINRDIMFFVHGGHSSMAERLTVDQEVAGSTPVGHPVK